jgi:hypothetical protein
MSNKLSLVTAPDDIPQDSLRVLLVSLTADQTKIISDVLTEFDNIPNTILYVWNITDSTEWLFDKKNKSDIIIFNASQDNQELVGYLAAQPNSYYFGVLRTLGIINNNIIHDMNQCFELIKETITAYEQQFK